MPMDGILLRRIVDTMNLQLPLRINRITQPSDYEFVFHCYGKGKQTLYISSHPRFGRIQFTQLKSSSNLDATQFLTLLRKHLDGGILKAIQQENDDRIVRLIVDHRDEMGVIREIQFIIELFSRYTNLILVDENNKIIDASKRLTSFEKSDRVIVSGATYTLPDNFDKKPIELLKESDQYESIRKKFDGVSPFLEKEITHRLKTQSPKAIIQQLRTSDKLYICQNEYHVIELTHLDLPSTSYPLFEGLDFYYKDVLEQERIKSHTGNILKALRRELKRSNSKLPKLYDDLQRAQNSDHYREMGDLLFAYYAHAHSGHSSITLKNFEQKELTIDLDPKLNGKENANRYFKLYRKAKNSLNHLQRQIEETENHIEYLKRLISQTEIANVQDAQEIKEELIHSKLIKDTRSQKQKKKPNKRPHYTVINYDEDTTIFLGKNNIQNDTITFKLAKKEDLWFHVANTFGAHVLLKTDNITDDKLELCANLAAYYSDNRTSSKVEVQYTEIKNIKKIPGAPLGTVRFSSHKSLLIEPNFNQISAYLKQ